MKRLLALFLGLIMVFTAAAALGEDDTQGVYLYSQGEECCSGTAEGGISSTAALEGYLRKEVLSAGNDANTSLRMNALGTQLTGCEKKLYDLLRPMIVQAAKGERSSAVFEIPISKLAENKTYTLGELGCGADTDDDTVVAAFYVKTGLPLWENIVHAVTALRFDMPYEMYWGTGVVYAQWSGCGVYPPERGKAAYYSYDKGKIVISLEVAKEYSATDETGKYAIKTTLTQNIRDAVTNIRKILQDNSDKNDYGKLKAYRDWIRDHVEYNTPALDPRVPYGNPWQLIWVFDNDSNTKVVCEGFSKAFKYLCDCTKFNTSITVICVCGDMSETPGGEGAHMWNVVTMNDGKRYMADVTNDWTGSLFLTGYSASEKLSDGRIAYKYGNFWYVYDDGSFDVFQPEELAVAKGGAYTGTDEPDDPDAAVWKDPAYTWGEDYGSVTALRESTENRFATVLETVGTTKVSVEAATCLLPEMTTFTSGEFMNQAFERQTITVDTAPALGHDWTMTTYTWNEDLTQVTASRICQRDRTHTETETVSATSAVTKPAACTEKGETTYTSARFANPEFPVQTMIEANIEPLGHDWGEPAYTWNDDNTEVTATRTCKRDATHQETETVKATSQITKEATCEGKGEVTYTGAAFENEAFTVQTKKGETDALDHDWDDGEITTEPTYSEEGVKTFTCKRCGEQREETVSISIPLGRSGWVRNSDGSWSYGDAKQNALVGPQEIDGARYCFTEEGKMITGWAQFEDAWYYAKSTGELAVGWAEVNGTWYYFRAGGDMATGWVNDGGTYYYMKPDGTMATGWIEDDGDWYYLQNSGAMYTGWLQSGNDWYLLKPGGAMAVGWTSAGGAWYYFKASGAMATGWQQIGGKWYYLKDSGAMATGWFRDKQAEAKLPRNQKKELWYWFDENGVMATGWKEINGQWEMFDEHSGLWLYTWQGN